MGAVTGDDTVHATAAAGVEDTVTITPTLTDEVMVTVEFINPNAAATFWVKYLRDGSDPGAAVAGAEGTFRVPPNSVKAFDVAPKGGDIILRVISTEGGDYSAEAS